MSRTLVIPRELVYETVRQIPSGKVATYGDIARLCGLIRRARFVGQALHHLPSRSGVPWHRVINSQGTISFPKGSRAWREQRRLLEREDVVFVRDKIDLEKYGWLSRFDRSPFIRKS